MMWFFWIALAYSSLLFVLIAGKVGYYIKHRLFSSGWSAAGKIAEVLFFFAAAAYLLYLFPNAHVF